MKEEVPLGAISVLGKGLGYVPYPSQNMEQTRLEMRLTVNRIINLSRRKNSSLSSSTDDNNINSNKVYSKLKRTYHGIVTPTTDDAVNKLASAMTQDLDGRLRNKPKTRAKRSNLTKDELNGLQWLENMINLDKLNVVQADKGGAILLVNPELLALQDGVSKSSDAFLAENFLSSLQQDFCSDLLIDTTDALKWLEKMDNNTKPNTSSFAFDFKSLYDSLSQKLVIDSLKEAMHECRPEWTQEFRNWLVDLVCISLESSVGVFNNKWYRQKGGIPTGGSLVFS